MSPNPKSTTNTWRTNPIANAKSRQCHFRRPRTKGRPQAFLSSLSNYKTKCPREGGYPFAYKEYKSVRMPTSLLPWGWIWSRESKKICPSNNKIGIETYGGGWGITLWGGGREERGVGLVRRTGTLNFSSTTIVDASRLMFIPRCQIFYRSGLYKGCSGGPTYPPRDNAMRRVGRRTLGCRGALVLRAVRSNLVSCGGTGLTRGGLARRLTRGVGRRKVASLLVVDTKPCGRGSYVSTCYISTRGVTSTTKVLY